MASPATTTRARVKQIIEAEFAAEGLTVEDDKLPRASAQGGARCACWPEYEREVSGNVNVLDVEVKVQLYLQYEAKIDPEQVVDPTLIEAYGDRLRRAFQTQSAGSTPDFWFLRLTGIGYPDDPTGNKSRLEASVVARCENPAAGLS